MEIYGEHCGGPASGIWCERCRRAGHEAKMCAAREPRRFNGLCDTCCELGHLSCDCLLQHDRIYSDVPTLSSPPQSNRSGPGYDIPCYDLPISPPSYSGRSGGPGYDIPCHDLPISPPSYSGHSGGPGFDIPCSPPQYSGSHCYRAKPFVRRYSGGDGTALSPQQQTTLSYSGRSGGPGYDIPCSPPQYSGTHFYRVKPFVRRYNGGDGTALSPQQQPAPRPFSSFVRDQRYNGGHRTAPQQQPGPRPFCSFSWEQRGACRDGPPVNGLANSITEGQAQRVVEMDCHGRPVSKVSGPPETTASLARGRPPL